MPLSPSGEKAFCSALYLVIPSIVGVSQVDPKWAFFFFLPYTPNKCRSTRGRGGMKKKEGA